MVKGLKDRWPSLNCNEIASSILKFLDNEPIGEPLAELDAKTRENLIWSIGTVIRDEIQRQEFKP